MSLFREKRRAVSDPQRFPLDLDRETETRGNRRLPLPSDPKPRRYFRVSPTMALRSEQFRVRALYWQPQRRIAGPEARPSVLGVGGDVGRIEFDRLVKSAIARSS